MFLYTERRLITTQTKIHKVFIFLPLLLAVGLQAGAICDFKIQSAKDGLKAITESKNEKKIKIAKKELEELQKNCDDRAVLLEVQENIKAARENLNKANAKLNEAYAAKDKHLIFQAELQYKIAHAQYIAARQEELRLKDLMRE